MANETKIILTAEDKTSGVLAAATRNLQSMQGAAALASSALAAIGVSFSGAAAVALVKGTIDAADGFNDLSQRVGIGIKELAGWTLAANQSGTSMESVAKGVRGLSTYMVEHADKLRKAGITATDANGAMLQLSDMFKAMPDGIEKSALASALFGQKVGSDLIPMLNMGSKSLEEAQQKAAAYGQKMAELAPDADKFNDQMEEFSLHAKAAGMNIANIFIPGLIGLSQWLNDVAAGGAKARQALGWLSGGLLDDEGGATGYSGPLDKFGLPAKPGTGKAAATNPRALLDKPAAAGGAKQSPLARMLAAQNKRIAELNSSGFDDQSVSVDSIARQSEKAELDALEKKRIAMEKMAEERMEQQRLESDGEEAIRLAMEKTTREMKTQDDAARQLGLSFTSAFEDAVIGGKKASEVIRGLGMDIARIFMRKNVTEPMANSMSGLFSGGIGKLFEGMFNPAGAPIASQGFGMAGDAGSLLGFAGGGFTGSGARSGGMDGQGGFLAMLHPQETVIDHAQGGGAGGAVTVILNISTGVAQTVRAEISNLLPSISASVQGAVMDARLRGGSTRAAYRG